MSEPKDDEESRRKETDGFAAWITKQSTEAPPLTRDLADLFPDEFEVDDDDEEGSDSNEDESEEP